MFKELFIFFVASRKVPHRPHHLLLKEWFLLLSSCCLLVAVSLALISLYKIDEFGG